MDSSVGLTGCMRHSLESRGIEPPPDEELHALVGLGLKETFEQLCPQLEASARGRIAERYRELWASTYRFQTKLFDGAHEAIAALAGRGYDLAVATGKGRSGLDFDLESTGLGELFTATRTISEARSKPHPEMLLQLMAETGAAPEETLMVGDSTFDVDMARRAGTAAVAVLTGAYRCRDLMPYQPLACLERLRDLPQWLDDSRSRAAVSAARPEGSEWPGNRFAALSTLTSDRTT